jgi:hypothetical protein
VGVFCESILPVGLNVVVDAVDADAVVSDAVVADAVVAVSCPSGEVKAGSSLTGR